MDWAVYIGLLGVLLVVAVGVWLYSLLRNDVSIVDSLWSLMFLLVAGGYYFYAAMPAARSLLVLVLVAVWALRLSTYITVRNHGAAEDHRYQEIRRNNEPNFRVKSLYIVFGLQAGLAWLIAVPLVAAMSSSAALGWIDILATLFWLTGMVFEAGGDAQLKRFKANPANRGQVLDTGLWRYTRHPNYFGEFMLWWGFYLFAVAAGGWWTVYAPLLMSFLLLRVSGVVMLEKTIINRRPAYAEYIRRTNVFFPGPRKPAGPVSATPAS